MEPTSLEKICETSKKATEACVSNDAAAAVCSHVRNIQELCTSPAPENEVLKWFSETFAPTPVLGALLGLVGLALFLMVRAEWPSGRANEGSPKTVTPASLALSALLAVAAGVMVAKGFGWSNTPRPDFDWLKAGAWIQAASILVFGYISGDLKSIMTKVTGVWEKIKGWLTRGLKQAKGPGGRS